MEFFDQSLAELLEIAGVLFEFVAVADAGDTERDVARRLHAVDGGDDFVAGSAELFGEQGRIEIEPPALEFAGIENLLDEFPLGGRTTGEDFLRGAEQLRPIGGVECAGRLDDAVDLQVGHHGGDHARADVADGRKIVGRDVEHRAEPQDAVDEIAEGAGRGRVGVDEVFQHR